ncbi:MAG: four helix bundle protein [Patescibacteria group bacterium]
MIKPSRKPYGYRDLMVYKKAEHLQSACSDLTHQFPRMKTLIALADQMDRSARSVKQNIVEGWKRNSTKEYYDFLGFSMGANSELEEDCDDICKGMYPELMGIRGIMGEKGLKGINIEMLRFYPVTETLPPVVRLKLHCRELNFLFDKLQKSLLTKMESERSLPSRDMFQLQEQQFRKNDTIEGELLKQYGLKRLENGQVVKDEGH